MKNILNVILFLVCACILQTTWIPAFFHQVSALLGWPVISYLNINVLFLSMMYLGISRNFFSGMGWFMLIVILQGAFDVSWKGAMAVSYLAVLLSIDLLMAMIVLQYSSTSLLILSGFILMQALIHLGFGAMSKGFENPIKDVWGMLAGHVVGNGLMFPVVAWCLYQIDRRTLFFFDKSKSFFGTRIGL